MKFQMCHQAKVSKGIPKCFCWPSVFLEACGTKARQITDFRGAPANAQTNQRVSTRRIPLGTSNSSPALALGKPMAVATCVSDRGGSGAKTDDAKCNDSLRVELLYNPAAYPRCQRLDASYTQRYFQRGHFETNNYLSFD